MKKSFKTYIISVLIALAAGGLSALLTSGNMDIYRNIVKPPLSPPSIVFPIVWTVLYILMGISAAAVWGEKDSGGAIGVYSAQLVVNFLWSIIFFGFRAYFVAFVWLILLWILIISMINKFRAIKPWAGFLQLPYLLWVTFAGYLNFMIFVLNR